jgi:hypothetical protein
VHRSIIRYHSRADQQIPLRIRLKDLAAARLRWGYRRLHVLLRGEGWKVNHIRDAAGVGNGFTGSASKKAWSCGSRPWPSTA